MKVTREPLDAAIEIRRCQPITQAVELDDAATADLPASLDDAERLASALLPHTPDGAVYVFGPEVVLRYAAGPAMVRAGIVADDLIGRTLPDVLPDEAWSAVGPHYLAAQGDLGSVPPALAELGARSAVCVFVGRPAEPFGGIAAFASRPSAFRGDELDFLQSVAHILAEAMRRERLDARARHQAMHDAVTGLPNRARLADGSAYLELVALAATALSCHLAALAPGHTDRHVSLRRSASDLSTAGLRPDIGAWA